jgi:hypothetical protein
MREEDVVQTKRYRFMLHKVYFEKGNTIASVFRYVFLGLFLVDFSTGLISTMVYGVLCWLMGKFWFSKKYGISLAEIEAEIGNQFNKFQQEMREKVVKK